MRVLVLAILALSSLSFSQEPSTSKPRVPAKVYVYNPMSSPVGIAIGNTGLTALQALATAEGLDRTAKLRYAEIIRGHNDTLLDIQGMIQQKTPDVELRANDALYISEGDGKQLEEQLAKELSRPVPKVNADDLKAVWKLYDEQNANHPGEELLMSDMGKIIAACTPGADVRAIIERIGELRFLVEVLQKNPETYSLVPWVEVDDAALEALATPVQMQQSEDNGYFFEVDDFVRHLHELSKNK